MDMNEVRSALIGGGEMKKIICPNCGFEIPDDKLACGRCGHNPYPPDADWEGHIAAHMGRREEEVDG